MYTYIIRDTIGNWFLSKWKFATEKAAEEEAAEIAEYKFVDIVKVIRIDSDEIKNLKSYLN